MSYRQTMIKLAGVPSYARPRVPEIAPLTGPVIQFAKVLRENAPGEVGSVSPFSSHARELFQEGYGPHGNPRNFADKVPRIKNPTVRDDPSSVSAAADKFLSETDYSYDRANTAHNLRGNLNVAPVYGYATNVATANKLLGTRDFRTMRSALDRARGAVAAKDVLFSGSPGLPRQGYSGVTTLEDTKAMRDFAKTLQELAEIKAAKAKYAPVFQEILRKPQSAWPVENGMLVLPSQHPSIGTIKLPLEDVMTSQRGNVLFPVKEPKSPKVKAPLPEQPTGLSGTDKALMLGAGGGAVAGAAAGYYTGSKDK